MPFSTPLRKLIRCSFIDPVDDRKARYCGDGAILLKKSSSGDYRIEQVGTFGQLKSRLKASGPVEFLDMSHLVAVPGFFDMHFHWVQDDVREAPKENLLDWLTDYTWPAEKKFSNKDWSLKKARTFSQKLLACGTLGGGCYGSLHEHSVELGIEHFHGDFVIGNVLMTMNSPSYLSHTPAVAMKGVKNLYRKYGKQYALTPRFAPTTHPHVMKEGAALARSQRAFVQSHLCETENEIEYVLDLYREIKGFEKVTSYTEVYKKCGILGPRTIMGHGIYLDASEWEMLATSKTIVAHCPTSNAPLSERGLGSGLFDYRKANRYGVEWALGSDIGAGPYLSMLDVMQSFVNQNRKNTASYVQALYRSTAKSASLLKRSRKGRIANGYVADLVFLPKSAGATNAEEALKKIIHKRRGNRSAYDNLVEATMVNGQLLMQKG